VHLRAGESLEATMAPPAQPPAAPPDLAEPVAIDRRVIKPNGLPLRLGADSDGNNRFLGDMARASVFSRALSASEIAALAATDMTPERLAALPGCLSSWLPGRLNAGTVSAAGEHPLPAALVGTLEAVSTPDGPLDQALHFSGQGFLEVAHTPILDCRDGVTLEAWVRPAQLPESGARLIDKSPAGAATAYLLDTCPGNSLRLIVRDPHLRYDARLAPGRWVHVAGTVDSATGRCALYLDGRLVAEH
jgi:hypothetical protein